MTLRSLRKRFRREVRERPDIHDGASITLSDDDSRREATRAVRCFLEDVFSDRIDIALGPGGIVCGCREEASALRLRRYTRREDVDDDLLGSSLTRGEIETYFKELTGEDVEVEMASSPELEFLEGLASDFEDVRYGI